MKLKKLLAVVLAFAMVLSTMGTTVLAAEAVTDADSLKAAIANGADVVLGSDIELTETLEISSDVAIDLNGNTLSGALATLIKADSGNITITNGKIKNVMENATTTLTSVYLTGSAVAEIKNVEIETSGTGIYLDGSSKITELNSKVKSYVDVNGYCVFDAISVNDSARIDVISGGEYTSNYSEKFVNTWNEIHQYSATMSHALRVNSPNASVGEIKGGTFIGEADKGFSGATIYVNSGKIETISGGYFGFSKVGITAQYPEKLLFANTNNGGSIDAIIGGDFEKGSYKTGFGCDFEGIVEASGALIEETGVTVNVTTYFSSSVKETVLNVVKVYLPAPVYVVELYRASEMARSGELILVDSFTSLEAAIAAAEDGDTIKVIKDFTVPAPADFNKNLTLDLNGFTVTSENGNTIRNNAGNTLTIKNGTIERTGDAVGYSVNNDNANSVMILEGVTIKGGVYTSGDLKVTDSNLSQHYASRHVIYALACNVVLDGGNYHNYNAGNATIFVAGGANVTIKDGKFSIENGKQTLGWTSNMIDVNEGTCVMNGGEYYGHFRVQGAGILEINGGTFENTHNDNYQLYTGSKVTVTGGTFTDSSSQTFAKNNLAENYKIDANGTVIYKNVAKIGDTIYEDIDEALAAAVAGDTLVLLSDVTPTLASSRAITKASVVDLNGKTLTITEDDLLVGEIEFKNGKIVVDPSVVSSTAVFWMFNQDNLTFNDVEIVATGVTGTYLIGINGDTGSEIKLIDTKIVIDNESVKKLSAVICDNGTGNNVVIKNADIDVKNLDGRLYLGGTNGTITVEDSDIDLNGVKEGFYIRAGQVLAIKGDSDVNITLNDDNGRYGINLNGDAVYTKESSATVVSSANTLSGSGTESDPYLINNKAELKWFRDKVDTQAADGSSQFAGKYFLLTADIDLEGENWNPIGSMSGDHGSFKGIFDGGYHTISNLYVAQPGNGIGLFARTSGDAVIKNLDLENVTVKSTDNSNYVGGLVGNAYESTKIENVSIQGKIEISGRGYVGGIAGHGYVVMDAVSVLPSETGLISSTFWCAGGILGYAGEGVTNIMNAHVEDLTITSAAGGLGAIVGMAEDNKGTQPISGSNLSAKDVEIKTYTGAYGDAYANYALGYLYGGNPTSKLSGNLSVENVKIETSSGVAPEVQDAVATIGNDVYFNLQDAIGKVKDGETIKVLRDITFTQGVNGNGISCTRDASFTLDLNGKTLSSNLGNITLRFKIGDGTYVTKSDVEITIKNGKVISGASNWCAISAATNTSSGVKLTLNLENVEAEANKGGDYAVKAWDGAVINAENVDVKGNVAGGFYAYGGEIILDDCTVVQTGRHSAIYMNSALAVAGKGKLTVNSGTYTSVPADNKSGHVGYVLSSGGQFIINGGKFVNNAENCTGGSPLMEFDASAVVELNGGEFEAAQSVMHVINNTGVASANPVVNVFGGNYDSVTGDVMFSGYPAGLLHIAGGSYSHDPSAYLVANFSANAENGMYKVSRSALDGTGSEADPYIISDVYDLTLFRDSVNKGETKYNAPGVWVALANDIDMTGVVWDKGIGVETATDLIVFEGNFDGKNKTIKNLTIKQTNDTYYQMAALFGGIYGNVIIKNLTLENPTIICDFANFDEDTEDSVSAGTLVGFAYKCADALIENVTVKGDIIIDTPDVTGVGGLVGYTYGKFGTIKNCSVVGNEGSYIKAVSQVGGLVGYNYSGASEFTGCEVKNLTISANGYMGGIAGVAQEKNIIKNNEIRNVKFIVLDETYVNLVGSVVGSFSGKNLTVEDYTVVDVKCNNKDVPVIGGKYDEPNVAYVAEIKNVVYPSLKDAFDAAVSGDTIKLLADIAVEGETFTIPADKAITLNLNGKTITALDNKASGNYEVFYNYGELTVVGNGTIELTAETDRDWNAMSTIFHNRGGELTIENGTFTHKGGTDMAYVVDNSGNSFGDATTVVNGGTLKSSYIAIRNRMDTYAANGNGNGIATLDINGGTFEGKYAIWGQVSSSGAKGNIDISNGTFIAAAGKDAVIVDEDAAGEINTVITGGTFSSDVSEYTPENIDCVQNADGTYSVVADREINIAVDKTELYAGEEVKVTVSIVGKYMAYADWKLSYNPAHFELVECTGVNSISDHDTTNGVYRNATFFEDGVSEYQSGQTLMTYTFRAKAQQVEVTSAFTLSETYATTYVEGAEAAHIVAGTNGKAEVTILLNEYEFAKKFDGAVVDGTSVKVAFDTNPHTFEVVPTTLPTGVTYTATYKVDGKVVSAVELTERGTYFIDYVIDAEAGYADYKGSFTVIVAESEFVVEINEYTEASDLILVYTNTADIRFKYDGTAMIDVTADRDAEGTNYTKYTYDGTEYSYVYGYVAMYEEGLDHKAMITYTGDATEVFKIDNAYNLADVNFSKSLNVQDITTIYGIANDNKDLVAKVKYQKQLLKADTNGNKQVDGDDTAYVVDAVKTALNLK